MVGDREKTKKIRFGRCLDLYCVACKSGLSAVIRSSGGVKFQTGMQDLGQVYTSGHSYIRTRVWCATRLRPSLLANHSSLSTWLSRSHPHLHPARLSTFHLELIMKAWASYLDDHELYPSSTPSSILPCDPPPSSAQSTIFANGWTTVVSCMKLVFIY